MKKLSLLVVCPLLLAAGLAFPNSATAQTLAYWDPTNFAVGTGSGGAGSWDSTSTNWWVSGASDTNWPSDSIANFAGALGTVTLNASETAGGLTFVTSNYLINGSSTLTLSGTPTITIPAGTNTISCPIAGTDSVTVSGPGTLSLTHANTSLTGGMTINSGSTVAITSVSGAGTGTITDNGALSVTTAGATFDVSALTSSNYTFGSTSLSAGGSVTAAAGINGASTGVVDLGARQISLSFTPQTFNGDSSHPALDVFQGALTLNGNGVAVRNAGGTPLGVGVYTLIQVIGGTLNGSATLGSVSGAGLAPNTSASLSVSGGNLNLVVAIVPAINSVTLSDGNLILSGANGPDNGAYYVLTSTNLALPLSQWTAIATNTFTATGTFSATSSVTVSPSFFTIEIPPR